MTIFIQSSLLPYSIDASDLSVHRTLWNADRLGCGQRMATRATLMLVLCMLTLSGCGTDSADTSVVDITAGDATALDVAPLDSGTSDITGADNSVDVGTLDIEIDKADGATCASHAECSSGVCGWGRFGLTCVKACSKAADCDATQQCAPSDPLVATSLKGCVDRHADLCRPCKVDGDCSGGGKCIVQPDGSGRYCATPCSTKPSSDDEAGAGCPKGFLCAPESDASDAKSWCAPAAGECLCTPRAIHATAQTSCDVINDAGHCRGLRVCKADGLTDCNADIPAEEMCDGIDNDCDSKTDNEIALAPCKVDNPNGSCGGVISCKNGKSTCSALQPSVEVCDRIDNDCDGSTDEGFPNMDGDALADCVDKDDDGDGVLDTKDNCLMLSNPLQFDADKDGNGDKCDDDDDNDAVLDTKDNCIFAPNTSQKDTDGDKLGDACDDDDDGDGLTDPKDNCAKIANKDQKDLDNDKLGDVCDDDDDGDGAVDTSDNCPMLSNKDQKDSDNDKIGDACDPDDDNDGIVDVSDNCPFVSNLGQLNTDKDAFGDACDPDDDNDSVLDSIDNCPLAANATQSDMDGDKKGDICDADADGDGVFDVNDNCLGVKNTDQKDADKDKVGDACDPDIDDDGLDNAKDNCPNDNNVDQKDTDKDKIGDLCDDDDDGDGVLDAKDNCPLVSNKLQIDSNKDGLGDACDDDFDKDDVSNGVDNCPKVANKDQKDTDGDKQGDACDDDDDGDGDPDKTDCAPLDKTISKNAKEVCSGVDEDCDGTTDESGAQGCKIFYADTDQDGFGVGNDTDCRCKASFPYTVQSITKADCAPTKSLIFPGAKEICDGVDNNCSGKKDDVVGGCALGSQGNPAKNCSELLAANKNAPDGFYWIAATGAADSAKALYCWMTEGGWTRIYAEGDAADLGWSDKKLTNATVAGTPTKVHGPWGAGGKSNRTYDIRGIVHTQLKVGGRFYAIDSWDNEKHGAQVWLAGKMRWSKKKWYDEAGGWGWTSATFLPSPWSGKAVNGYWNLWAHVPALKHTSNSVLLEITSGINQAISDESFAFGHITVWVK